MVSAYTRGFALDSDYKTLIVTDSFTSTAKPGLFNVSWAMHTKAQISLDADGRGATLSQAGQKLRVVCGGETPKGAVFTAKEIDLKPPQIPTPGLRKLMLDVSMQAPTAGQIEVHFQLAATATVTPARMNHLSKWGAQGPFHLVAKTDDVSEPSANQKVVSSKIQLINPRPQVYTASGGPQPPGVYNNPGLWWRRRRSP